DPAVAADDDSDPADRAGTADSVSLALLTVLETLAPAERTALVLHDLFAVPFDEIATVLDRSSASTRQLASRARKKVQGAGPERQPDRAKQREIAHAWLAAARGGDFARLVELLHPDVVLRVDTGDSGSKLVHGATDVAGQATAYRAGRATEQFAVVNGDPGIVSTIDGHATAVLAMTVRHDRIT